MNEASPPVRVWDLPTRLFHWLLVLLIPLLWWTAEEEALDWHRRLGLTLLGLLLFRIFWGFAGSSTARFSSFVKGPRAIMSYLNGRMPSVLGHNPLGGLNVVAMLGALAVQAGLGLFASDEDGLESGPLAHLISYDLSEEIAELHEAWFNVLLVLIGIHIAAILYYAAVKRDNLVKPMLTGSRDAPPGTAPMKPAPLWRLLLVGGFAAGVSAWLIYGF